MSEDIEPDRNAVPEADRPPRQRAPVRSLSAPAASYSRPALAPPTPTVTNEPEQQTRIPDIGRTRRHLYVTIELPGGSKESIDLNGSEDHLTIHATRPAEPAYDLEIDLCDRVEPTSARATYHNGVLDVTLDWAEAANASGGESDAR